MPLICCMPIMKTARPVRVRTSLEKTSKKLDLVAGVGLGSRLGE